MRNPPLNLMTALGLALLLAVSPGCAKHQATSRMSTDDGRRKITAVIDGHATFQTQNSDHIISYRNHQLRLEKERLVIDEGHKIVAIPAAAAKVDIRISQGTLTVSADGAHLLKTPI